MSELHQLQDLSLRGKKDEVTENDDSGSSGSNTPRPGTPTPPESSGGSEVAEGMQCGFKNLYAGPEDRRGRFKWVDKVPDDLGKPVEDKDTAKWALIVRHVKVFNDPRRVLRIHSIVVQSPLLKEFLGGVLKDYPGVTTSLQRLTFGGKFEPFIHRWTQLEAAIEKEENAEAKEHAELLYNVLKDEFKEVVDESVDHLTNRVITYDLLWTLFVPGTLVYSRQNGQETAMRPYSTQYGVNRDGNRVYWITCQFIDWDGSRFGTCKLNLSIDDFDGTKSIPHLPVYPLHFHPKETELRQRLLERGAKWEQYAGSHYRAYQGVGWKKGQWGQKDKYNIKGRIMIDTAGWNRFNTNQAVYTTALRDSDVPNVTFSSEDDGDENNDDDDGYSSGSYDESEGDMPYEGAFPDEDDDTPSRKPLTDEQKLMCTSVLRGYSFSTKEWLHFVVGCVKDIEWNKDAFDKLVLPSNQKELVLGFTESQRKFKNSFDDIVEGKGKGIILLLCGPPGVGKTLTAESVAEEMHVPLYMMSAGDLGLDPSDVERKLTRILEMCTKWNAVLLIDEADVFLEQRSLHELERNKLVSIFLRILEYYEGIMFLTTNRVQTFDPAFASRIHISLEYPDLTAESRRMIWKNFLSASSHTSAMIGNTITEAQLDSLSLVELNGRQIKNVLKTSQLLAGRKDEKLSISHIKTVLDVTQHLHNATQETDRQRSAIFC